MTTKSRGDERTLVGYGGKGMQKEERHVWSSPTLCVWWVKWKNPMTHTKSYCWSIIVIIVILHWFDLAVSLLLHIRRSSMWTCEATISKELLRIQGNQWQATISKGELLRSRGNQRKGMISKDWVSCMLLQGGHSLLTNAQQCNALHCVVCNAIQCSTTLTAWKIPTLSRAVATFAITL